jgi:hypothetical protein
MARVAQGVAQGVAAVSAWVAPNALAERAERVRRHANTIEIVPYSDAYRDQVVEGAEEMHRNSVYHDLPLDRDKVVQQLAACGNLVPDRYFRIAVRGDVLLGGFFGHVRRTFFCDELLAHDMGWWVLEHARGGAAAILLLADFEVWARKMGAKKIMVGQSTEVDILRTTKLFNHCGFRIIGFNTLKDL